MEPEAALPATLSVRPGYKFGVGLALLATFCWANTGILIELITRDYGLSAVSIAFWRTFFITGLLGLVVLVREGRQGFSLSGRELGLYSFNGAVGIGVFSVAWSSSVQVNGAAVATTLIYSAPVFVALGSWPLLGEKPGRDQLAAILINITGCALVAGVYDPAALFQTPLGFLLGLISGLTFGLYTLVSKLTARSGRRSGMSGLFYFMLFGLLTILPWGLIQEGGRLFSPGLDGAGWFWMVVLAYGPTLGGNLFYYLSLQHLPAAVASLFTTLEPPVTAIFSLLFLGRGLSPIQWVGALLIIAGVLLLQANLLRLALKARKG